ncbi:probable disease resistance protein At4g27220 [Neltuma alba]|uniref:probable disease resistance protein At4g27220 n=1 Tax=Neltuma alba TaxID=207710 RepID=UPI0010A423E1|nr:probable disease resistance protein At4g27220 [Prosopis alba]
MGCKKVIKVKRLYFEDGWDLFFESLGVFPEELSSKVENIALIVADECEGFPLAIVRTATSMKGETKAGEWRHMLECLENLGNGQYEMDKWMADHLIRRFVYESIDERKKLRLQYNEGRKMLHKLKGHSMLDKFLRVLAIGIVEETSKIMRKAYEQLTEVPSDDQWEEDLQKVFLTGNNIQTIPDGTCPKCSQLSTLLLDGNVKLGYIADEFFNNMPALKILDLSRTRIKCLPESVSKLECLIALLLSGCVELSYIPSLRKLKRLISLDLSFTAITKAPGGLESLVNLRCLNLLTEDKLEMSDLLLSKLINLECLKVGWAQCLTDATGQSTQDLEKFKVIVAYFRDIGYFNAFVKFPPFRDAIRSYCLTLKDSSYNRDPSDGLFDKDYIINHSKKKVVIEDIFLANKNVRLPPDMKELDISDCHGLEYLCCSSGLSFPSFQHVQTLRLWRLWGLTDLVSPNADFLHQSTLFSHLADLEIGGCNSMKTLMPFKLLALLQNLSTISVNSCEKMEEIVGEDHSVMEVTHGDALMALLHDNFSHPTIELPMLTSLKLDNMPQLDVVYRGIMLCPSLQTFSAIQCERLSLPRMNNGTELLIGLTSDGCYWEK